MSLIDVIVLALAVNGLATAWFYGSIFESIHKKLENKTCLLAELLTCQLCLPYHIAFWFVVLLYLPSFFLSEPFASLFRVPIYTLAVTTLVHYMQGVLPPGKSDADTSRSENEN